MTNLEILINKNHSLKRIIDNFDRAKFFADSKKQNDSFRVSIVISSGNDERKIRFSSSHEKIAQDAVNELLDYLFTETFPAFVNEHEKVKKHLESLEYLAGKEES